eukprot:1245542-Pleurochrysis_carterae.AAC.1
MEMCSNASRMNFEVSRPATAKMGYLNQEQRRAKFQLSPGSGKGAMSTCGVDDNCCNDALRAGLAQGR